MPNGLEYTYYQVSDNGTSATVGAESLTGEFLPSSFLSWPSLPSAGCSTETDLWRASQRTNIRSTASTTEPSIRGSSYFTTRARTRSGQYEAAIRKLVPSVEVVCGRSCTFSTLLVLATYNNLSILKPRLSDDTMRYVIKLCESVSCCAMST